jgi:hypothetical protein
MIDTNEGKTMFVSIANESQSVPFDREAGEDRQGDFLDVRLRVEPSLDNPSELLSRSVRCPLTAEDRNTERDH